jgi:hypothetical protein
MILPIDRVYFAQGRNGNSFRVEVSVNEAINLDKYPEGVKAVFRMLKILDDGEEVLMALVDNHKPFGFHYHDRLPDIHKSREAIHTDSWKDAWVKFQEICKEILNEF